MTYLTSTSEINSLITEYTKAETLWIDTEVADYNTRHPRLSLIQVLDDPRDMSGKNIYLLDVLDKSDVVDNFIDKIMSNPKIEKVFHHASYDIKLLGKSKTQNITCTMEMAKKVPYYLLPLPNYQLKTLATVLCNFQDIDKQLQASDWGQRPLSTEQIEYAYLDCIYLAQVYLGLLELESKIYPNPDTEDLTYLGERCIQLEHECKLLNSELEHLQTRIKTAMQANELSETSHFKLTSYDRTTLKVNFSELAQFVQHQNINLDFPITITQKLKQNLDENLDSLPIEKSINTYWRLTPKSQDDN
ncbi:MAG: ribonuclease D [Calothrix sp. MO_167.B12]|nr:ribonuclease D [Calothrix sp. MO_167.B12]